MPGEETPSNNSPQTKKTTSSTNLNNTPNNLQRMGSKLLTSRMQLYKGSQQVLDQNTLMKQAMEAGQRVYENTFKMKPEKKFQTEPVQRLITSVLEKNLKGKVYAGEKVQEWIKLISSEILSGVKEMQFDRYKIVVDVTICEAKGQGVRVASRCLWDTKTDSCASSSFKNASMFAIAVVFGCYFE